MPSYYLELPETGISAEVEAPSTRSAQTTYLDYLTRNNIVPWKGRNALRPSIVTDRIESGQMDVDINLSYSMEPIGGAIEEPEVVLGPEMVGPQPQFISPPIEQHHPVIDSSRTDVPPDVPTQAIGQQVTIPIQAASRRRITSGRSRIEQLSKSTIGRGKF